MPMILGLPFLACLILTGIHVYLGIHIVRRGVIFVDLALAQVAALGATVALLIGYDLSDRAAYFLSLGFTGAGAVIFSLTRQKREKVPQEAIIGIVYVVSAAGAILVLDRAPGGAEHIRALLVGNILTVTVKDIVDTGILYAVVGLFHWVFRNPFLEITFDQERMQAAGRSIYLWDFLFYLSFGLIVTSSVHLAGVLLVFAFLVVPAVGSLLFMETLGRRLALGWGIGGVSSVLGLWASYAYDLPTGATVVCAFGLVLVLLSNVKWLYGVYTRKCIRSSPSPASRWPPTGRPPWN
jgi:zinc/manganese transport system permease protein